MWHCGRQTCNLDQPGSREKRVCACVCQITEIEQLELPISTKNAGTMTEAVDMFLAWSQIIMPYAISFQ